MLRKSVLTRHKIEQSCAIWKFDAASSRHSNNGNHHHHDELWINFGEKYGDKSPKLHFLTQFWRPIL